MSATATQHIPLGSLLEQNKVGKMFSQPKKNNLSEIFSEDGWEGPESGTWNINIILCFCALPRPAVQPATHLDLL